MQAFVMGITGAYHTDFPCLVNQEHPLLKKLDLTNTQLHGHGTWPKLNHLHLCKTPLLRTTAASYLVKSHWPLPKTLASSGAQIGFHAAKEWRLASA
ncbi:hypothetical protein WJX79_005080 [Trebouxia sp. C0005]